MSKSVIFPEGKQASAEAYLVGCNAAWIEYLDLHEPGIDHAQAIFGEVRLDYLNQPVVTYYGPPYTWDGINHIPEPAQLVPLRADGVIHDYPIWPDDI